MREALEPLAWARVHVVATVGPWRAIWGRLALCLRDLADEATGEALAEHAWAFWPEGVRDRALVPGVRVACRVTVRPYRRGDGSWDYHLTGLRQVRVLREED